MWPLIVQMIQFPIATNAEFRSRRMAIIPRLKDQIPRSVDTKLGHPSAHKNRITFFTCRNSYAQMAAVIPIHRCQPPLDDVPQQGQAELSNEHLSRSRPQGFITQTMTALEPGGPRLGKRIRHDLY